MMGVFYPPEIGVIVPTNNSTLHTSHGRSFTLGINRIARDREFQNRFRFSQGMPFMTILNMKSNDPYFTYTWVVKVVQQDADMFVPLR